MSGFFAALRSVWQWFKDLGSTLKPCRFSVIVVLLASAFLIGVPQCQEALRGLAERNELPRLRLLQWLWFFITATFWAWSAWYWARQMLNVQFPDTPPSTLQRETLRRYVPRVTGVAALVAVTFALWRAGGAYRNGEPSEVAAKNGIDGATLVAGALTLAFFVFVQFRRRLFSIQDKTRVAVAKNLPVMTWRVLGMSAGIAFLFFLLFWLMPVRLAPQIGAPAILLLAASTWIPLGSIGVYLGSRFQFPVLVPLAVAVVLFGVWNDNHAVRMMDSQRNATPMVENSAAAWLDARSDDIKRAQKEQHKYPVFVVAAAGGGIRAAYWTAVLLAGLEDHFPGQFSRHIFGISGVSGGSVGAAAFVALLAEQETGRLPICQGRPVGELRGCASAVMSQDFLAPVLAAMLYPDLTQRFLPFAVPAFDRARALEQSWEKAWRDQGLLGDRFAAPLDALWDGDAGRNLPLLFLNSTVVESGRRAIASPVLIDGFQDSLDLNTQIAKRIPLSTAAHLSARFTYVSPAASVRDGNNNLKLHLVDGGYFENAGASTAVEVMARLLAAAKNKNLLDAICPRYLMVTNAQGYIAGVSKEDHPVRFLTEVLAPIDALFNARDAHSRRAEAGAAENNASIQIGLRQREGRAILPLGWMLSDTAQHEIDDQLTEMLGSADPELPIAKINSLLESSAACR